MGTLTDLGITAEGVQPVGQTSRLFTAGGGIEDNQGFVHAFKTCWETYLVPVQTIAKFFLIPSTGQSPLPCA